MICLKEREHQIADTLDLSHTCMGKAPDIFRNVQLADAYVHNDSKK